MAHVFLAAAYGHLGEGSRSRVGRRFESITPADIRAFAEAHPDPAARRLLLEGLDLVEGATAPP